MTSQGNLSIVVAIALALGIFALAEVYGIVGGRRAEAPAPPAIALPDRDTYFITSKEPGPQIYEASFDPLGTAKKGVEQKVQVKVRYENSVDAVNVIMTIDDGPHPLVLTLKEGSLTDGAWEGSWKVTDTHDNAYQAEIEAKSGETVSRVVLSFR